MRDPEEREAPALSADVPWAARLWPTLGRRWLWVLGALLVASVASRLVAMAGMQLIPEEAYYWNYSQHLALSYYDHPPMVAWMIGLGTSVFGDTEFGVRIVGSLLMLGSSVLMFRLGRTWFGPAEGFLSALLLQVLPIYFITGFVSTMDAALIFFWILCMMGVTAALRGNSWGWYLGGFALGATALSKYTGIFLAAGTGLAILAHRPWRRHLKSPHPYLGFLLAVLLFSPVIAWNAEYDWASFRFQFLDRYSGKAFSGLKILKFLGYQVVILTPALVWVAGARLRKTLHAPRRLLTQRRILCLAFSLPLIVVLMQKSFRTAVHINWSLPAYLSLLPAVSRGLLARARLGQRWPLALTLSICMCLDIGASVGAVTFPLERLHLPALGPWRSLAAKVEGCVDRVRRETGRDPLVVAKGKYKLASVLAFYRRRLRPSVYARDHTTGGWILGGEYGLAYAYWTRQEDWIGRDIVYVSQHSDEALRKGLSPLFEQFELVDADRFQVGKFRYRFAVGLGFKPLTRVEFPPSK